MSHSSGHSGSSLLHLHRPPQLYHDARTQLHIGVKDRDDIDNDAASSICSSPTSSIIASTTFCPPRSGPSMQLDTASKVAVSRPSCIRRISSEGHVSTASTLSISPERADACRDLLRSVQPSSRVAKPRSEWQPDADTAFCSQPCCSTMFSQTTLSFGPRRHHCRLCGFIFCSSHSSGRMPLHTGDSQRGHRLVLSRVCDGCVATPEEEENAYERRLSDTTPSLTSSETSVRDDLLLDPRDRHPMTRSLSSSAVPDAAPHTTSLAPIEAWMDRSGVLSLYPLAVQASHSRRSTNSASATASASASPVAPSHAVGPLFAPSMSERRNARDKEMERLSVRRRRNVRLWISTPVGSDNEGECGVTTSMPSSPIKASGTQTPQEREREMDWSTF